MNKSGLEKCFKTVGLQVLAFSGVSLRPPFAELRRGTMLLIQDCHERCGLREAAAGEEVVCVSVSLSCIACPTQESACTAHSACAAHVGV